jgi:copper resistance protein C
MNKPLVQRTGWRLLTVLALVVTMAVGGAGAASAHDTLVGTSPAANSTVPTVPGSVTLTFDQPALALGTELVVTGPGGPVQSGAARAVDNTVTQSVQPGAPAGRYTVLWRVTSVDGHPVSGRFTFTAKAAAPGTRPAGGAAPATSLSARAAGSAGGAVPEVAFTVAVLLVAGGVALFRRRRSQA